MRINRIRELVSGNFVLLSGSDANTLGFIQLGGRGAISVTASAVTHDMAQMCKLVVEEHFTEARIANRRLMPLHNKLFVESNPVLAEWACKELGLMTTDMLRLPVTPITDSGRETVRAILKHVGLL